MITDARIVCITLPIKVCLVKAKVLPVVMYGCESWTIKKVECYRIDSFEQTVVLEKILESPLNCKEIQPVYPKGDQSWIFIGRTDAETETPILWPPDVKSWLIGKDPDVGKDWRWEEKGTTENEILDGITDSVDMSLGRLRSWWWTGRLGVLHSMGSQRDTTEQLNWSELKTLSLC